MAENPSDGGDSVVPFPSTEEERRAMRRAKQEAERQRLINLFIDDAAGSQALFHTPAGECFADLIIDGVRQTWAVRSKTFRAEYVRYLRRQFEQLATSGAPLLTTFGPTLKKSAVNAAIDDFELRAIASSIEREVHVRVAGDGDHIYIDLGDPQWHAVRITGEGWTVVQGPPVRFRRPIGMQALPFPVHGTQINALRPFLPNLSDDDFILVVAYLLAALQPRGPYPITAAYGEHGSAKTSFVRILRALVDPNRVASASLPASGRELFIAAHNSHLIVYENVSQLTKLISDDLFRLATAGEIAPVRCSLIGMRRCLPGRGRSRLKGLPILSPIPICSVALSSLHLSRWKKGRRNVSYGVSSSGKRPVFLALCAPC
jgi:hypothetical protein